MSVSRVLYHHRTQGKAVEGVHIRGITDALRAQGIAVDIISLPGADPYRTPAAMSPTRQATSLMRLVSSLPQPLFELAEIAYNLIAGFRVWNYLRQRRDVSFIYERYSLFLFSTVLVARCVGIPVILEINDSASVDRVRPLTFRRIALAIERWTLRRASGLVFVSTRFRDCVAVGVGEMAPAIVTPNAANLSMFTITPDARAAARSKLGATDQVVCGYLGAFVPWHYIDKFVYEFARSPEETQRLKLLLVGDGATHPEVQNFVEKNGLGDKITLAGRVSHAAVPDLLAAMDVAILPNAGDYTSPVKLFEFMACGIPPIAPDLEPITEVLDIGRTGWCFPAGNMEAAVATLVERSADPAGLRAAGEAAREYVGKNRQWKNNVDQLLAFHREICGARRATSL